MKEYFYQNPEYKPVEMSKRQLIDHLTKRQDECFDEELAKKCFKIPDILKQDFAYHLNPRYNRPLKKEVFVFHKGGTNICGGFWMSEPTGTIQDPIKVTVAIKQAGGKYEVYDFDWNESLYCKEF